MRLLANAGMQFEFVYDLYFAKQFIESNLTLKVLYTSSWLYDTLSPFLLTNVIIVFCPIKDLRITKRFVVKVFDFDMIYKLLNDFLILLLSNECRIKFVIDYTIKQIQIVNTNEMNRNRDRLEFCRDFKMEML